MKYLFILGRNPELSIAEIKSYFKKECIEILNETQKENGFLISLATKISDRTVDFLGGTISIAEVLEEGSVDEIIQNLDKTEIYFGEKNNINYCFWNFSNNADKILDYLRKRFKSEKLKASLKSAYENMVLQSGKIVRIPSSKHIDEEYFLFESESGREYFGKIIQKSNYEEIKKRDMEKPVRRESLAISPRLAKIMINLSEVKEGEILVDPFCGIGVVLEEALNQKIRIVGIDKNKSAIQGSQKNLEWFGFNKKYYELINEDSKKIRISGANVIVTEPDLGEVLKKNPTKENAKKTLKNFEILMIQVLNNLKNEISGKIVFTSPLIRVGKKRIGCDIDNITEATGLNLIGKGFDEFRENQIVGRRIFVLNRKVL